MEQFDNAHGATWRNLAATQKPVGERLQEQLEKAHRNQLEIDTKKGRKEMRY